MSATLNAGLFSSYFDGSPTVHIPGRTFPVNVLYLEEALAKTSYKVEGADYMRKVSRIAPKPKQGKGFSVDDQNAPQLDQELDYFGLMKRYPCLNDKTAKSLAAMDTEKIQYPLIELLAEWILNQLLSSASVQGPVGSSRSKKKGFYASPVPQTPLPQSKAYQAPNRGVLIFLPGFAEIATLHEMLLANPKIRQATGNGRFCLALHSTLSSEEQMRVFNRPPDGTVKIVIATNVCILNICISYLSILKKFLLKQNIILGSRDLHHH